MNTDSLKPTVRPHAPGWGMLTRKNILAGLLFIAIAGAGLWISRNYPIGSALRMGTGYVPRLLLWILLGLGAVIFLQGLREANEKANAERTTILRPLVFVTIGLIVFGLTIERLGLVLSILPMMIVGSLATRDLKMIETAIAAVVLIVVSVIIFIFGLGLTIPVWPEW